MTKRLVRLDGEMSDSELKDGAVLIQIGMNFDPTERFSALLGWPEDTYFKSDQAMAVHGIDPAAIAAADPPTKSICNSSNGCSPEARTRTSAR